VAAIAVSIPMLRRVSELELGLKNDENVVGSPEEADADDEPGKRGVGTIRDIMIESDSLTNAQ
jgi:hypothetical protein